MNKRDINALIFIRDTIKSNGGRQVLSYAVDFMIENASRLGTNAEWVKGMGMLINHLEEVDEECQKLLNKERN